MLVLRYVSFIGIFACVAALVIFRAMLAYQRTHNAGQILQDKTLVGLRVRRPRWLGRHHRQSPDRLEKEKTMRTIGRRSVTALALAATVLTLSAGCGFGFRHIRSAPSPVDTVSAPTNLTWENHNGVQIPRSLSDGPKNGEQSPTGYSQTPQGAVLATIRGQAYLALTPDTSWGQMVSIVV